jgi:hypothetical protein
MGVCHLRRGTNLRQVKARLTRENMKSNTSELTAHLMSCRHTHNRCKQAFTLTTEQG